MPKISDLIEKAEKDDGPYFAVEYFPPRTADGLTKLYERSARIAHQSEFPGWHLLSSAVAAASPLEAPHTGKD